MAKTITYKRLDGTSVENSIGDILMHIGNHGTYPRAHIALRMKQNGLQPTGADYIAFARTL